MTQLAQLTEKYKQAVQTQLGITKLEPQQIYSREYELFRKEALPRTLTLYEKLCNWFSIFNIRMAQLEPELQEHLKIAHLQIKPVGATSLAIMLPSTVMILGIFISLFLLNFSLFFVLFSIFGSVALVFVLLKTPAYIATTWRMRASNQMVLCIFYIVTYMRHTSNLERAIEFASQYLTPPLSLDLKKILWDVEVQRYDTVKESLDTYLETWRTYNPEFIESFHLIEASLYESSEDRRLGTLEKALEVMLEGTKEKMLHYVQNLKSPITTLHMLGVVMPILGMVILPLVVSFMQGVAWYHIATLYNIILPVMVFTLSKNILASRPTGYGDVDITELNPALKKYEKIILHIGKAEFAIKPVYLCMILGITCLIIALTPVLLFIINPDTSFDIKLPFGFKLLEYRQSLITDKIIGPYGLGASILSLFFPLSLALSIGLYLRLKSQNIIQIRERTKKLEDEFASALYQLGNRLGDGLPAEIAFPKVAQITQGTVSGKFFELVSAKLAVGTGLEQAITEATELFPSNIIQSSMKILVEGVKKGPVIAAQALVNVARYIKEIHQVNERLRDLLSDIISDVKSQINFLAPVIAGIMIGLTSMITYILGALSSNIAVAGESELGGRITQVVELFGDSIPTYYFQLVIGTYVFQLVYLLTIMANGIENGADKLNERYNLGKNTIRTTLVYIALSLTVMLFFNAFASKVVLVTGVLGQ
ncbi:MAG: hypothetical protein HY363_06400 [Candidatus Aenigmarchaeota archaeon]|nr:hypothetical protein [Candidatus Aenigmarchaeota archaeon]